MSDGYLTDYGFKWGPVWVQRLLKDKRGRLISVYTAHRELQIWVSEGGRSVQCIETKRRAVTKNGDA